MFANVRARGSDRKRVVGYQSCAPSGSAESDECICAIGLERDVREASVAKELSRSMSLGARGDRAS
jgi:hypothetical protein